MPFIDQFESEEEEPYRPGTPENRRKVFVTGLDRQIAMLLDETIAGEAAWFFWEDGVNGKEGAYWTYLRYGTRAKLRYKGRAKFKCGPTREDVLKFYQAARTDALNGDLDAALEEVSTRKKKK